MNFLYYRAFFFLVCRQSAIAVTGHMLKEHEAITLFFFFSSSSLLLSSQTELAFSLPPSYDETAIWQGTRDVRAYFPVNRGLPRDSKHRRNFQHGPVRSFGSRQGPNPAADVRFARRCPRHSPSRPRAQPVRSSQTTGFRSLLLTSNAGAGS